MKHWKITIKRVTASKPIVAEVQGDYELEDIRLGLWLGANDVEWFTTQEINN